MNGTPPSQAPSKLRVSSTPVEYIMRGAEGEGYLMKVTSIQQVGESMDVVCGFSSLKSYGTRFICLMKEPGVLKPVLWFENKNSLGRVCFDGKYAWVPVSGPTSGFIAVDVESGEPTGIGKRNGLTKVSSRAAGLALGEGKTLWIGSFRDEQQQTHRLLELDITPSGAVNMDFYDPTPAPASGPLFTAGRRKAYDLPLGPNFVLPVGAASQPQTQLLLGQWAPGNILLDIPTKQYIAVKSRIGAYVSHNQLAFHQGNVYWTTREKLIRCGPADIDERTEVASVPERGCLHFDETGRIYLIGTKVWSAANVYAEFLPVESNLQPLERTDLHGMYHSAHYGVLLEANVSKEWLFFSLEFGESQ